MSLTSPSKGLIRKRTTSPVSGQPIRNIPIQPESKQSELNTPRTPVTVHPQPGALRSLLGLDYLLGSSSPNVTPENIYATANISAFAALLSLVALVVGIITLMLTHERSLLSTMKTSYEFMKELSEGYHAGIKEIERKTGGSAQMDKQLSEFVQTMHALPWRQLRESIDQQQLEELFKVLVNVPQTIDQAQDMAWSVCVALRRIFGLTSDYCIPSERHAPAKIIIEFKHFDDDSYAREIFDLRGEYLEKGLSECVENWHKQAQDQIINLLPVNRNNDRLPDDTTLNYYKSLSSTIAIKPRVFEKLMIHQYQQEVNIWSTLYGINIMLISRRVLYDDFDWHIDYVQIRNIQTFVAHTVMYNPTDITETTPDIQILPKSLKVRDPVYDSFSEFHIFEVQQHVLSDMEHLNSYRMIEYKYVRSPFIPSTALSHYKDRKTYKARKTVIKMDRNTNQWTVHIKRKTEQSEEELECLFKASMDKPLHKKTSWEYCETQGESPPIVYIDEIEVRIINNSDASGTYKLNDNPFEIGYFAQHDPNPNNIYVMKKPPFLYRFFMAKGPDNQWYLQRFHSQSKATHVCSFSFNIPGDERHSANNTANDLCTHVVPYKHWKPNTAPIKQLRALSIEFSYNKDRIHSIYLIYERYVSGNEKSDENSISLLQQILIKGSDIYFKMYTKKDENNLDKYYNQIVLDMTTFNVVTSLVNLCHPQPESKTELPTLQLHNYDGKVEAIGGKIEGKFIIVFYHADDCRNLFNTIHKYSQPISFIN
eukprot:132412_1